MIAQMIGVGVATLLWTCSTPGLSDLACGDQPMGLHVDGYQRRRTGETSGCRDRAIWWESRGSVVERTQTG